MSLLSGRAGRTLDQLTAELGVTKRTIQRDIAVLEAAGFPVTSEPRDGTVYWRLLDTTKETAELSFTLAELMALYFSRDLLKVLHGSPMEDALESALQKIGARLPASGHDLLRQLKQQTAVSLTGWKDYSKSSKVIDALNRAIRHRLTVRVTHKPLKAPEARTRMVDPYRLWYTGGGLYLVAYDHAKAAIRTFAVERIIDIATTNQRFAVEDDFDFEAFAAHSIPSPRRCASTCANSILAGSSAVHHGAALARFAEVLAARRWRSDYGTPSWQSVGSEAVADWLGSGS